MTQAKNAEVTEIVVFIEAFEPADEVEQMTPEQKTEYEDKIAHLGPTKD